MSLITYILAIYALKEIYDNLFVCGLKKLMSIIDYY